MSYTPIEPDAKDIDHFLRLLHSEQSGSGLKLGGKVPDQYKEFAPMLMHVGQKALRSKGDKVKAYERHLKTSLKAQEGGFIPAALIPVLAGALGALATPVLSSVGKWIGSKIHKGDGLSLAGVKSEVKNEPKRRPKRVIHMNTMGLTIPESRVDNKDYEKVVEELIKVNLSPEVKSEVSGDGLMLTGVKKSGGRVAKPRAKKADTVQVIPVQKHVPIDMTTF